MPTAVLTEIASLDGTIIGDLLTDTAGDIFGVAQNVNGGSSNEAFEVVSGASVASVLGVFDYNTTGAGLAGGLAADGSGKFYGTTFYGGGNSNGEVYQVDPAVPSLTGLAPAGALHPEGPPVVDAGNVFFAVNGTEIDELAAGSHTLTTFVSIPGLEGKLTIDSAGNIYGTTGAGAHGYGSVFEIAAGTNVVTSLVDFDSANGDEPSGGVVLDGAGNLYGNAHNLFEIAAGTHTFSQLATFADAGVSEVNQIAVDAGGDIFGTTTTGSGSVYELAAGSHTVTTVLADAKGVTGLSAGAPGFLLGASGGQIYELTVCFCRGTRLATERGEVAVEDLKTGDRVKTWRGALRPIQWIGRRRIEIARHPRPDRVYPVRIEAGALGEDRPARDLLVSPEHALWLRDALVPARELINGATIRQQPCASVEYFHIELETHDILIAEGAPAESYLDCGNRRFFDNAPDGIVSLHPEAEGLTGRAFASAALSASLQADFAARAAGRGRWREIEAFSAQQRRRGQAPRTNNVRNPRAEGAAPGVLGQGGRAPTDWWLNAPPGVCIEVLEMGEEDGLPYIDLRFFGEAEAGGEGSIYPEPAPTPAARPQDWTASCYLRNAGAPFRGVRAVQLYVDECAPDGAYLDGQAFPQRPPTLDPLAPQRGCATYRVRHSATSGVRAYLQIAFDAGTVEATLRIAGFQIEQGDYGSDLMLPPPGELAPSRRGTPTVDHEMRADRERLVTQP